MGLRHPLFFLSLLSLSGCFAAYIPEPHLEKLNLTDDSAVVAFSLDSNSKSKGNSGWSRFNGKNSLGHQYLFPGFPVTRLYFERNLNDVLGEFLLNHPKLGLGARAITNLTPTEFNLVFGANSRVFTIDIKSFSASGQDYFFLRKATVEGVVDFDSTFSRPEPLEFSSSRYISKATVEVISELIEESLFNSLQNAPMRRSSFVSIGIQKPLTTFLCVVEKPLADQDPCLSKKNISIGIESYFRKKNLKFVSFRDQCPEKLPVGGYFLLVNAGKIAEGDKELEVSTKFSLSELTNQSGANITIKSEILDKKGKSDSSSSEPACSGIRKISEELAEDFFNHE
jgi:hypothetical protein